MDRHQSWLSPGALSLAIYPGSAPSLSLDISPPWKHTRCPRSPVPLSSAMGYFIYVSVVGLSALLLCALIALFRAREVWKQFWRVVSYSPSKTRRLTSCSSSFQYLARFLDGAHSSANSQRSWFSLGRLSTLHLVGVRVGRISIKVAFYKIVPPRRKFLWQPQRTGFINGM